MRTTGNEETAAQVRALVRDLLPVLAPHAMLDADSGDLVLPVDGAHADIGLETITATCAKAPRHTWPGLVQEWLERKTAQVADTVAERRRLGDVEGMLRVQLVPRLPAAVRRERVCLPYGDLLDAVVWLHRPGGGLLSPAQLDRLAITDLGDHAVTNTVQRELPSLTVTEEPLGGRHTAYAVGEAGNPFATSVLLDPERFLPGSAPASMLVGLPRYSRVLLYPVEAGSLDEAARALAEQVRREHASAPDPCTAQLLWWSQQRLFEVHFSRIRGRVRVPRPLRRELRESHR